ncbi:hypothetical protein PO909_007562 [Leuciscus waleckii]
MNKGLFQSVILCIVLKCAKAKQHKNTRAESNSSVSVSGFAPVARGRYGPLFLQFVAAENPGRVLWRARAPAPPAPPAPPLTADQKKNRSRFSDFCRSSLITVALNKSNICASSKENSNRHSRNLLLLNHFKPDQTIMRVNKLLCESIDRFRLTLTSKGSVVGYCETCRTC